jgi:hypothetical protein
MNENDEDQKTYKNGIPEMEKSQIEKDLAEIGETYESFVELNKEFLKWGEKRGWNIVLNRLPKKGWRLYGLQNGGKQLNHEFGLKVLEDYFDSPITMLNKFIKME